MPYLDQHGIKRATPVAGHDALQVVGGGDVRGAAGQNAENENRVMAPSLRVSALVTRTIDLRHKPLYDGERGTNRHRRVKDPSMNLWNSQSLVALFRQPEGENILHEPIVDPVVRHVTNLTSIHVQTSPNVIASQYLTVLISALTLVHDLGTPGFYAHSYGDWASKLDCDASTLSATENWAMLKPAQA
ncbi:hypothetical protein JB92DRAFT_2832821 [Gautieria morchelliformis]|nr:hypothetical protein JB92DRAFT_2832821 [Gautieria morchelliformis]